MRSLKDVASPLMTSLGVLALSLAAMLSVTLRAFFLPDHVADHVAASLADPRVSSFAASRLTDVVLRQNPDLTAFRPVVLGTAQAAVSSEGFRALARTSARAAHTSVFSEGGRDVIVSIPDVGVLLRSALAKANPALAQKVPERARAVVASIGEGRADRVVLRLWRASRRAAGLALASFVVGVALALAGVATAASRRRGLVRLGLDLVVAGVALLLLVPAGRVMVSLLPQEPLAREAAAGLWDAFMGALRVWGLVLGASGLVLAAAGQSMLARFEPGRHARAVAAWMASPPGGARVRLLHGVALTVVGVVAMLAPGAFLFTLTALAGGALAFVGLREIFDIVVRAQPEAAAGGGGAAWTGARLRVAVMLAMAAGLVLVIALAGRPPAPRAGAADGTCNGAAELCGRRLDEVVFPSTHNAMSAADIPNWMFPQQESGIAGQLEDGIRGLLVDVHYGIPVAGRVKTDLASEIGSRDKLDRAVGKEGVDAAMRIRDRLAGEPEGERGLYLCHGFCELGATPLAAALRAIHEFLVSHPGEVLVIVIEDYVAPEDLAAEFEKSGLADLAYRGPAGPPWPTLRELIDSRQRVLVLTESGRGGVAWIHPAFDVMQETPYSFKQPSELSCAANRGGTLGSLFLINNWIDTTPAPKPSNAAIVNAYEALLARARRCQAERGRRPNLVAVDFYRTGALFPVVRTLNEEPLP